MTVHHGLGVKNKIARPGRSTNYNHKVMFDCLLLLNASGSAGKQLFVYIQTVQSYLAPPLTVTFTLGIAWPGLTEAGALTGIAVGFVLGIIKFIVGNVYPDPSCGEPDNRPGFAKMHFMFYGK